MTRLGYALGGSGSLRPGAFHAAIVVGSEATSVRTRSRPLMPFVMPATPVMRLS